LTSLFHRVLVLEVLLPPVALAWALLFVVGFATVYRFFAWIGRRFRRKTDTPLAPEPSGVPVRETTPGSRPTIVTAAEPDIDPVQPPRAPEPTAEPFALAQDVPAPLPAGDYAGAIAESVEGISVARTSVARGAQSPSPVSASIEAGSRRPLASSAVISARIAATAVRTALAPSVTATLPPTSADAPAGEPVHGDVTLAEPDSESEPKAPETTEGIADASCIASEKSAAAGEARAPRPVQLRARKIGADTPSLDIRLRDARARKVRQMPKASRKPAGRRPAKGLRVLLPKDVPARLPARRIRRKTGNDAALASTKMRTKVIGTPHRAYRVLDAPVP
jgi:hypothetical protein